mgnify:FL=1
MKISKTKISTVIIFYLRIFILVKLLFFTSFLNTSKEYEIWTYMKFISLEYMMLIFVDKKNKVLNLIVNLFFFYWVLKIYFC